MQKNLNAFMIALFCILSASMAFAVDTTIADLFAAASFTSIVTGIGVLLLAGVGMNLLYVGYRYLKKTFSRA
jgi:hypothetical protein